MSGMTGERLSHAREVLRRDGLVSLLVAACRHYLVDRRDFYLYEHRHHAWPEGSFSARLDGIEEAFVASNAAADIQAMRHEDFRRLRPWARRALDSGAVAFCVYHGHEVAHVAWLATSDEGRRAVDRLGYQVRFGAGEAWTGAAWTARRYRGRGLLKYSCHRRFEFLLRSGWQTSRAAVEIGNNCSHTATMQFEPRVYAIGRQWRVLGWRSWTQRTPASVDGPRQRTDPPEE